MLQRSLLHEVASLEALMTSAECEAGLLFRPPSSVLL